MGTCRVLWLWEFFDFRNKIENAKLRIVRVRWVRVLMCVYLFESCLYNAGSPSIKHSCCMVYHWVYLVYLMNSLAQMLAPFSPGSSCSCRSPFFGVACGPSTIRAHWSSLKFATELHLEGCSWSQIAMAPWTIWRDTCEAKWVTKWGIYI